MREATVWRPTAGSLVGGVLKGGSLVGGMCQHCGCLTKKTLKYLNTCNCVALCCKLKILFNWSLTRIWCKERLEFALQNHVWLNLTSTSHNRFVNIRQLRSIHLHYSWVCATYLKLSFKSSSSSSSSSSELSGYITELDTFLSSPLVGTTRHAGALWVNGGGTGGENGTSALRKADTDMLSKHARHTSKAVGLAPSNLSQALQVALHDYWLPHWVGLKHLCRVATKWGQWSIHQWNT